MKKFSLCLAIVLLFAAPAFTYANNFVNGKVIDGKGSPVIGASIVVKGTKIATISAYQGKFSIKVPGNKSKLVISYAGFDNTEVAVKSDTTLVIKLKASHQGLEKVSVTENR